MDSLKGRIVDIVFQGEDTGYAIIRIFAESGEACVLTGTMPLINCGEYIEATGNWVEHPVYGRQFKVQSYEKTLPQSEDDVLVYLSSGVVRGVGKALARRIVRQFGEHTMDVIVEQPDRLAEVKGISLSKAREISESFVAQRAIQEVVTYFAQIGLSANVAYKVYNSLGALCLPLVQTNPYILANPEYKIGFRHVDQIAAQIGYDMDSPNRMEAALRNCLSAMSMNGHTCLEDYSLINTTADMLNADPECLLPVLENMLSARKLIGLDIDGHRRIYLPDLYNAEMGVAKRLLELVPAEFPDTEMLERRLVRMVGNSFLCGAELSDEQLSAVKSAICRGVTVITGGPGTGKTTTIRCMVELFEGSGLVVSLAAPTGRAAKRMTETSGAEAKTVHRMLEISYTDQTKTRFVFNRDRNNPLDADVVIVDEMSMMDIQLMEALLVAIKSGCRLVLVGDADQLPSVGPGKVLQDIMDSGICPVVYLTQVYRQAAESMIITNAHRINQGEMPICNVKDKDFYYIPAHSSETLYGKIITLCKDKLPATFGFNPTTDIQIITPTRRGDAGVAELNKVLQQALNPKALHKTERKMGDVVFRVGDRVMQNKNNYDMECYRVGQIEAEYGVYNGDLGTIREINNASGTITVELTDGRFCTYDHSNIEELEQAFATTVHKSQGSEFPCVVLVLFGGPRMLQNRNLLYTAVTRARKLLVVVGLQETMATMVRNKSKSERMSSLREMLEK